MAEAKISTEWFTVETGPPVPRVITLERRVVVSAHILNQGPETQAEGPHMVPIYALKGTIVGVEGDGAIYRTGAVLEDLDDLTMTILEPVDVWIKDSNINSQQKV